MTGISKELAEIQGIEQNTKNKLIASAYLLTKILVDLNCSQNDSLYKIETKK